MRIVLPLAILAVAAGCHQSGQGDAVRDAYDNKADAVDAQARTQPDETARTIYHAHADSLREEGADREKGLEGGTPSSGPDSGAKAGGR